MIQSSKTRFKLEASYFCLFLILSLLFFNQVLFGYYYDPTSFLSIWNPWSRVIADHSLINPVLSDQVDAWLPMYLNLSKHFSFWDPYTSLGDYNWMLVSSAVYCPLNFIFFLFPGQLSLTFVYILQTTLSGYFMFLFLRKLAIKPDFAILGGVVYMFSSKFISSNGTSISFVMTFFPLYFYSIKILFTERFRFKIVLLSVSTACIILTGFLHLVLSSLLLGTLYIVFLAFWNKNFKPIRSFCFASMLGILLTAFVLLPSYFALSDMDVGFRVNYWNRHFPFINFIHFINPYFFGNPVYNTWWGESNLNEASLYSGILFAIFLLPAVYLIIRKKALEFIFFLFLFLLFIFLCFNFLGILSVYKYLPLLANHPPTRFSNFLPFFLIVISSYGINEIYNEFSYNRFLRILSAALNTAVIFSFIYFFFSLKNHPIRNNILFELNYWTGSMIICLVILVGYMEIFKIKFWQKFLTSDKTVFVFLLLLVLLSGVLFWIGIQHYCIGPALCFKRPYLINLVLISFTLIVVLIVIIINKIENKTAFILIALSFIDVFFYIGNYKTPTTSQTFYPSTKETTFLQNNLQFNQRILCIGRNILPNTNSVYQIPSVQGHSWTNQYYKKYMQLIDKYYLTITGTMDFFRPSTEINSPLIDFLNVKYLITDLNYSTKEHYIVMQKEYNSHYDMQYPEEITQTFNLEENDTLNEISINCAALRLESPLILIARIENNSCNLIENKIEITDKNVAGKLFRFNLNDPLSLDKGVIYNLHFSLGRNLSDNEYFKVNCVREIDIYPNGELLKNVNKDLTFSLIRNKNDPDKLQLRLSESLNIFENKSCMKNGIFHIEKVFFYKNDSSVFQMVQKYDPLKYAFIDMKDSAHFQQNTFSINKSDTVYFIKYDNDYLKINSNFKNDGFIVIPDNYFDGWKAFLDGREIKIIKSDLIFRGITVPKGNHIIEFKFKPVGFLIGFVITIIALLILILLVVKSLYYYKPETHVD